MGCTDGIVTVGSLRITFRFSFMLLLCFDHFVPLMPHISGFVDISATVLKNPFSVTYERFVVFC